MLSLTIKVTAAAALAQAVKVDVESKHDKLWFNAYNDSYLMKYPLPRVSEESFKASDYLTEDEYSTRLEFSIPPNMGAMVFENSNFTGKNHIFYSGDTRTKFVVDDWLATDNVPSFHWGDDLAQ